MENMGPMIFTVGVIGDTDLDTDVVVSFSTVDGFNSGERSVVMCSRSVQLILSRSN